MIDYMSALLLLQCGDMGLNEERRRYWTVKGPPARETVRSSRWLARYRDRVRA